MPRSPSDDARRVPGSDPAGALRADSPEERPRLIVLVGPTGTGKSDVALLLAERIGGEIVGCDALQVYRGFDAATAKPSLEARRRIRHHLIDVADPSRDYSMADYLRDADAAIARIVAAGGVPIVAGGTGLYLRALLKGIVETPARDEALRARLRRMAERFGSTRLHRWLKRLDPDTAARLMPGDTQRVVRAIELARGGSPWSRRLAESGTWRAAAERYETIKFGLDLDRRVLAERLARRVEGFFAAGLVEEVRRLRAGGIPARANAWKAIGYREVLHAMDERRDPEAVRDAVLASTRRYAKRQRTWFRGEPGVTWLDAGAGAAAVAARIEARFREIAAGPSAR